MHGRADRHGTVHICLVRYEDVIAFIEAIRVANAYEWYTDHDPDYEKRANGELWTRYTAFNFLDEISCLEQLSEASIEVNDYVSKSGTEARNVERLDWPLFYGWAEPSKDNRQDKATAFVSAQHAPHLLKLECDRRGEPATENWGVREHFLRARQTIRDFARIAAGHLRPEHLLTGPVADEDYFHGRDWEWYGNTAEERRRNRVSSTLGKQTDNWKGPTKAPETERVDHATADGILQSENVFGGRQVTPYTSDEDFKSAFQTQLARRRSRAQKGRS
jgi:hypothetical protein